MTRDHKVYARGIYGADPRTNRIISVCLVCVTFWLGTRGLWIIKNIRLLWGYFKMYMAEGEWGGYHRTTEYIWGIYEIHKRTWYIFRWYSTNMQMNAGKATMLYQNVNVIHITSKYSVLSDVKPLIHISSSGVLWGMYELFTHTHDANSDKQVRTCTWMKGKKW